MEQMLITGLLVSLMGGLGWLGCHYPRFAVRVIIVLLAFALLLHLNIKMYQRGWHDNHTLVRDSVKVVMDTLDTMKLKQVEKLRFAVTKAISDSDDKMCPLTKTANEIFFLLETALAALLLFAVAFVYYALPKIEITKSN
jgi:hypothetical protein